MSDATVTFDLFNALKVPFDARRTKVWVTFNTDDGWIVDENGDVRMDAGTATITDAGHVTIAGIPVPGVDTNPTDFQIKVHFDAPFVLPGVRGLQRKTGDFGWMTVTADADLSDLIAEQYVPPTWISEAIATLQGYVDQGLELLQQQTDLSNIDTTDTAIAYSFAHGAATPPAIDAYLNVFKVTTFTTAGVQATINTADTFGGGTIYMPEAAYDFTAGNVVVPDNAHSFKFLGDGIGKTVITKAANTRGFYRPISTNVAGVLVFEDIEFIGQGGQGNAENHTDMAVHIADATGSVEHPAVFINRCKASKCNSEAFYTAAALNVYTNNIVDDCAYNAFNPVGGNPANRSALVRVEGNVVSKIGNNNGSGNMVETVSASVIITGNHAADVAGPGIVARAHHTVVVANNTLLGWVGTTTSTSAAAIQASRGNASWNGPGIFNVSNNVITGWPRGIIGQVSADTDVISQITIANNTINTIQREGIWLEPFAGAIKNALIVGNSIVDAGQETHNTYDAIRVGYTNASSGTSGTITRPVIQGNTVVSTTATKVKYAVNIQTGGAQPVTVTDALVKGNDFRDCWATAMINNTGTNTVRLRNLPGGTLSYAWMDRGQYFWIDANGAMRSKATAPTTDLDGVVFSTSADLAAAIAAIAVLTATKTTDQTVNNSATVVADTELIVAMAANSTYEIGGCLFIDSGTTPDFRLGMNGPGGATSFWGALAPAISVASGGSGSGNYLARTIGQTLSIGGGGAGTPLIVRPIGRVITSATAGNFNITFAQNTADPSDTKILAGSFVTLRKIS